MIRALKVVLVLAGCFLELRFTRCSAGIWKRPCA